MAVLAEVAALELKLDAHVLPAMLLPIDAAFGLAVGVDGLDRLHDQAQLRTNHPEQIDYALLVDRCIAQTVEVERCTAHPACPFGSRRPARHDDRRGCRPYALVLRWDLSE